MSSLSELAQVIDAASDAGDEVRLRKLADDCERQLATARGEERVHLRYYQSNAYAAIVSAKRRDTDYTWSWEQPDGVKNILLLRQAISEPAFQEMHPILACQIRTNLANRLSNLGRPVAANEQWMKALKIDPTFAKALAGRAEALALYGELLYDRNHTSVLLAAAVASFDKALDENAFWESGDRELVAPDLTAKREEIGRHLDSISYDADFDLNQWPLGSTRKERLYRRWCLRERLFLNPLNEACTETVAATDVLHVPDHIYSISEKPRFPLYYNLMKQEYVSARYRLYRAIHEDDPEFGMRDVLMLDGGEGQSLGHYTEDLRSAFRSSYAILDKIGLFLNDYFEVGLRPRDVTFRRVWWATGNNATLEIRPVFKGRRNWPLRGLYFLSKDLFDEAFQEVSEPDAHDLAKLRHQLEHRFLSFQQFDVDEGTETHRFISMEEFERKTLRLLAMAREALIYASLAMHREEAQRRENDVGRDRVLGSVSATPVESFRRY